MGLLKGILFDKDGTLVSFEGFWIPFTVQLVRFSLKRAGKMVAKDLEASFLQELGVEPTKKTLIQGGVLAEDTTDDLIIRLVDLHIERGLLEERERESFLQALRLEVTAIANANRDKIIPFCDLPHLLSYLKEKGFCLGIATHDSKASTQYFLEALEIESFFQYVGCAEEGIPSKPHLYFLHTFCEICQLKADQVAVIGDTLGDLKMARRGGAIAIGVLSGITKESLLRREAHLLLPSVNHLIHPEGGLVIEEPLFL